ncbi:MAG: hypothetical protein D6732_27980 [Methanobacteriota archaeon]|nr:MAG: hypothetical protein D6732_27980 [Euryarchaeota archaeon]
MLIEIYDTGEMREITDHETTLKEDSVYLLLSYRNKRTYIWTGKDANVRKRFIAAKEARRIKMETGFQTFNVQHDDMYEDFENDFVNYMNDLKTHKGLPQVLIEQRERLREDFISEEPRPISTPKKQSEEPSPPKTTEELDPMKIVDEFSSLQRPKGMVRDYMIVDGKIFSILEGEDETRIEPIDGVPDGFFDVANYEPRVLVKGSRVVGIEFWRKR